MPPTPLRVPRPSLVQLPAPAPAVPIVKKPERLEARATVEPPASRPAARAETASKALRVDPNLQPVLVGAFSNVAATAQVAPAPRETRSAGFDTVSARAPELKIGAAKTGAFDAPAGVADPRPGVDRPAQGVALGGFGNASSGVASPTSPPGRAVADAGFGGAQGGSRAPAPSTQPGPIRTGSFDVQAAAPKPTPRDSTPAPRLDMPVEVVSKPTPDYTEEARSLKVEGDVVLEVQFAASGQVRVVRVVRGLGHGLDESAVRAAQRIRFKPAQSGGRPIDFQTTVHIVFRLT